MTITESELREILNENEGEGHGRSVTVAGVHRRVHAIRRRRRWTAGGAVVLGLVASLVVSPSARSDWMPEDVWTGVMARPSPGLPTTSQPLGGPYPGDKVASGTYRTGGTREELRVASGDNSVNVNVRCSGPIRRAVVWIGDGPPLWYLCGTDPDGNIVAIFTKNPDGAVARGGDRPAGEQVVSAAVLPGEIDGAGRTMSQLAQAMDDLFEGWEEELASARPFPLQWSLTVQEMISPVCRDNVRQVDPRTGEMVRLSCEGEGTTPPGSP